MFVGFAGNLMAIGLSERNLELLRSGKPIDIDMKRFGGEGKVFLFYGKSEIEIGAMMEQFIGPKTDVQIDDKLKQ